jgi:hypothetical protein
MPIVKVSAASARLMFTECGPSCIAQNGCNGNCCDAPSKPTGCLVTIHPLEQHRIERLGATVVGGMIKPDPRNRGCPFKKGGLCSIHDSGPKPFGCRASPFTLNRNDTLIIRNRYKMLPCYRGPGHKEPAYRAFRSSLDLLFSPVVANDLVAHLDSGGGDWSWYMRMSVYTMLEDNDRAKKGI